MSENKRAKHQHIFGWSGAMYMVLGYFTASVLLLLITKIFDINNMAPVFYLLSYVLTFFCCIWFYDMFAVRSKGAQLSLNLKSPPYIVYGMVIPLMLGAMFVGEFFTQLIPTTGDFFGPLYKSFEQLMMGVSEDKLTLFIMTSLFAPILEEIIFRGIIQKGLINKGVKPAKAIFYAALIFGLVHGNPWQFIGALILGLVLGYAYYKTNSLLVPIVLHAFNNFCAAMLLSTGKTESFSAFLGLSEGAVLAIGMVLLLVFGYLFSRRKYY